MLNIGYAFKSSRFLSSEQLDETGRKDAGFGITLAR